MKSYTIHLAPYCENCPEFSAQVDEVVLLTDEFNIAGPKHMIERKVTCEHAERCRNMVNYLKNHIEKEKEA